LHRPCGRFSPPTKWTSRRQKLANLTRGSSCGHVWCLFLSCVWDQFPVRVCSCALCIIDRMYLCVCDLFLFLQAMRKVLPANNKKNRRVFVSRYFAVKGGGVRCFVGVNLSLSSMRHGLSSDRLFTGHAQGSLRQLRVVVWCLFVSCVWDQLPVRVCSCALCIITRLCVCVCVTCFSCNSHAQGSLCEQGGFQGDRC